LKRQYWYIIITYVLMQLSVFAGVPLLLSLGIGANAKNETTAAYIASGYWAVISFSVALVIISLLLRDDFRQQYREQASIPVSIMWAIAGFFLAFIAQAVAVTIELHVLGIEPGSENTRRIVELIRLTPLLIIVTSIIGPILEEVIFRKIIFGTLYKKYNFFIAAVISSLLFAVVHMEFEHLLLYSAMGFTFAFLYVVTKRILVPIFAHVAMNTLVVIFQTILADDMEKILKEAEKIQFIFGGF